MADVFPFPAMPIPPDVLALEDMMMPMTELDGPADKPGTPVEDTPARDPRIIPLTPEQETRLMAQLRAHYQEGVDARDNAMHQREVRTRRYDCDPSLREGMQPWDDAPRLFLPLTRRTEDVLNQEFTEAMGGVEAIDAGGMGDEDIEQAKQQTHFLRHVLTEINPQHWDDVSDEVNKDALRHGLGVYKVYPYAFPFLTDHPDAESLKTIIRIDRVDEMVLLKPPDATGLQWPECGYLGHQMWPYLDELPSMERRGFTVPVADDIAPGGEGGQYTEDENRLLEFTHSGFDPHDASGEYNPKVEMVEMYELFDLEQGAEREFLVIHWFPNIGALRSPPNTSGMVSRVMKLKDALRQDAFPRPLWPFFEEKIWAQAGQLHGMNVPDRLETSQDLLNRLAEQMIEQGEADILPIAFGNIALAGDLPDLRRVKPGQVVPLDNMGSVTFAPRQSNTRHYVEEMHFPRSWAEEDSGVIGFFQGRSTNQPSEPKTLGGLSLQIQQAQKGFKKEIKRLARQRRKMLKFYLGLWRGHIDQGIAVPMPDTEGLQDRLYEGGDVQLFRRVTVTPATFSSMMDLKIRVNPDAYLEQQKRLMLAEKLDTIVAPSWPLGRREIWKGVWETMGMEDFDTIYPEPVAVVETLLITLKGLLELEGLQMQVAALEAQKQQAMAPNPSMEDPGGLTPQNTIGQGAQQDPLAAIMHAIQALGAQQPEAVPSGAPGMERRL